MKFLATLLMNEVFEFLHMTNMNRFTNDQLGATLAAFMIVFLTGNFMDRWLVKRECLRIIGFLSKNRKMTDEQMAQLRKKHLNLMEKQIASMKRIS